MLTRFYYRKDQILLNLNFLILLLSMIYISNSSASRACYPLYGFLADSINSFISILM